MDYQQSGHAHLKILFFFFTFLVLFSKSFSYPAYIISPVADLYTGRPSSYPSLDSYYALSSLDEECSINRVAQLLFNSRIEIIEEKEDYAYIKTNTCFYSTKIKDNNILHNTFWIKKKDFCPLFPLSPSFVALIPPDPFLSETNIKNIYTLKIPYRDSQTHILFSAGTRFLGTEQKRKRKAKITYYLPQKGIQTCSIDLSILHRLSVAQTPENIRDFFLEILYSWTKYYHPSEKKFPYVWGGASLTETVEGAFIEETLKRKENKKIHGYRWENSASSTLSGCDCTSFIMLACQIAKIPLILRNSSTYLTYLHPIPDDIKKGDIIAWQGHACVIDPEQNMIIEAVGYTKGYGYLVAHPINKVFEGIHSSKELLSAYRAKKKLHILNSAGKRHYTIQDYQIFSLLSAYKVYENIKKLGYIS